MKRISLILLCSLLMVGFSSQAQEKRKSPAKTVEGMIGDTKVTINYGAPSVRGRQVFGDLEPYGKVWRAGANEATTIEFSKDVKINGEKLSAGKYAFFVTPMESGDWPIVFNTEHKQWGAYNMNPAKNALKSMGKTSKIEAQEVLRYVIDKNQIHLDWSTTRISFTVE